MKRNFSCEKRTFMFNSFIHNIQSQKNVRPTTPSLKLQCQRKVSPNLLQFMVNLYQQSGNPFERFINNSYVVVRPGAQAIDSITAQQFLKWHKICLFVSRGPKHVRCLVGDCILWSVAFHMLFLIIENCKLTNGKWKMKLRAK